MEDRTYDSNLILNKVFNDGVFTVRQDTNNILNAVYSEEDTAIKVNVTNLPEPTNTLWENYIATAAYASYTGTPTGCSTPVTITADTTGTEGNDISLNFHGIEAINARITDWNSANPTNTCTLTTGVGTQVPNNKIIVVLTGGVVGGQSTGVQTIGLSCTAIGNRSLAEGYRTVASGDSAHAEGFETVASGYFSHAEGSFVEAHDYAEHVGGQCNVVGTGSATNWVATDNLFTLGNGIDSDSRSNAFQVKKNGQVIVASSVKVGTDSTSASIANIGAIRYSSTANSSNCEMVMQTGASTYAWVVIKTNTW